MHSHASGEPGTAEPHVSAGIDLSSIRYGFLVLMSDGLYDAYQTYTGNPQSVNKDIAYLIKSEIEKAYDVGRVAQNVVNTVKTCFRQSCRNRMRNDRMDDITLVVRNLCYPLASYFKRTVSEPEVVPRPREHVMTPPTAPPTVMPSSGFNWGGGVGGVGGGGVGGRGGGGGPLIHSQSQLGDDTAAASNNSSTSTSRLVFPITTTTTTTTTTPHSSSSSSFSTEPSSSGLGGGGGSSLMGRHEVGRLVDSHGKETNVSLSPRKGAGAAVDHHPIAHQQQQQQQILQQLQHLQLQQSPPHEGPGMRAAMMAAMDPAVAHQQHQEPPPPSQQARVVEERTSQQHHHQLQQQVSGTVATASAVSMDSSEHSTTSVISSEGEGEEDVDIYGDDNMPTLQGEGEGEGGTMSTTESGPNVSSSLEGRHLVTLNKHGSIETSGDSGDSSGKEDVPDDGGDVFMSSYVSFDNKFPTDLCWDDL